MFKFLRKFLRVVILIVVLSSFVVFLLSLPIWHIKKIYVEGNTILSKETILDVAEIPQDENIFFLNKKIVKEKLLALPQIKNVKIFTQLPNTIIISIQERKPFAVVVMDNKSLVIDNEGYIIEIIENKKDFETIPKIKLTDLPTVLKLPKEAIVNNNKIDEETMKNIEFSFLSLEKILKNRRFELELYDNDNINLIIDGAYKVKLGSQKDIERKFFVLEKILSQVKNINEIEYIDLSAIDYPAVMFKKF